MTQAANCIDKKLIAKNTIFMYIRMIVVLGIGFFTVRLVLEQLGIQNYGVFSLVSSFIGLFCFASGGLGTMLRRFYCYETGRGNEDNLRQIFTMGMILTTVYAVLFILIVETFGMYFLVNKLNIAKNLLPAAKIVLHLSLLSSVIQIFIIPFNCLIVSYEKMSFFAQVSVIEALLKIGVVLILVCSKEKLIFYSALTVVCSLILLIINILYCRKNFVYCRFQPVNNKALFREMANFASWNILETVGNLLRKNGSGVVLNMFCGVAYNATWGIAGQIQGIIAALHHNLLGASAPQILKSYASEDRKPFYELLSSVARYAFLLLWLPCFPLLFKTDFLLHIWLGNNIPPEAVFFVRCFVAYILIDSLFGSLWVAGQANGKVIRYQLEFFILCTANLVFAYMVMKYSAKPVAIAFVYLVFNIINLLVRLRFVVVYYHYPCAMYLKKVLLPVFVLVVSSVASAFAVNIFIENKLVNIIISAFVAFILNPVLVFFIGITRKERGILIMKIKEKILLNYGVNNVV